MKIAINAIRVSRKSGGGLETYIINLVNALGKLSDNFDLYTLYLEHFPCVKKENIKQIKIPFLVQSSKFKVQSNDFKLNNKLQTTNYKLPNHSITLSLYHYLKKFINPDWFRMFWTQFVLPFHLVKKKYDVLFSPTQLDAIIFCPIPQIVTVHDTIPFFFPEYKHKQMFYLKHLLPSILRKARRIITISQNTKNDVIKIFGVEEKNVSVIHYGMRFAEKPSEEEIETFKSVNKLNNYVLCVSSNLPHKNLLRLIEAFDIIRRQNINIDLLIVGFQHKKYQEEINKKVKNLGLMEKIKLWEHLPQGSLSTIYAGAEVFVFASLYEGFGLPPLEAMACGCPVVVSNTGSLPEVVGDAGVYVNPYSPESIAQGIMQVLSDENLRKNLIKKGYERVKQFSWEKAAKETLKVFEEVVA